MRGRRYPIIPASAIGIWNFKLKFDLDDSFLFQCAEKLFEGLLRLYFIIVRLNPLFNLFERRRGLLPYDQGV